MELVQNLVLKTMDAKIATNSTLYTALQYLQCSDCYYVGKAGECWMRADVPCPDCGSLTSPTSFPGNWYSMKNFPVLQELYEHRKQVAPAVLVMSIFITESILTECTKQALWKKGVKHEVIDATLENSLENLKGSENLANYLARLAGSKSIDQLLNGEQALLDVWKKWKNLRTMRNHIAHGKKFETKPEEAEESFQVCCDFHSIARYILNSISNKSPAAEGSPPPEGIG